MWQYCDCLCNRRLKAEIEKIKLDYEETAAQEQQKHSNEVKVNLSFYIFVIIMSGTFNWILYKFHAISSKIEMVLCLSVRLDFVYFESFHR